MRRSTRAASYLSFPCRAVLWTERWRTYMAAACSAFPWSIHPCPLRFLHPAALTGTHCQSLSEFILSHLLPPGTSPNIAAPMFPLFSDEQMKQMEEMEARAPLISRARALRGDPASASSGTQLALEGQQKFVFEMPEVRRPAFLADEEQRRGSMPRTPSPPLSMRLGGGVHPGALPAGVYGGVHNGMRGFGAMPDLVVQILHQAQQEIHVFQIQLFHARLFRHNSHTQSILHHLPSLYRFTHSVSEGTVCDY